METRTCLVCGGSGFEVRWQSSSDMEDWHNGACEECHGFGYVMVSDHNEESVMQSEGGQRCEHGQYRSLCPECSPLA